MMKTSFFSFSFLLIIAIISPASILAQDIDGYAFLGVGAAGSLFSGGDFSGDQALIADDGILAIPEIDPGYGWAIAMGIKIYWGDFLTRYSLNACQTFHQAHFSGRDTPVNSLMFNWDLGLGYRVLPFLDLYISGGWIIPLYLFVENGFESSDGTLYDTANYFSIEGVQAALGMDLTLMDWLSLFIEVEYRLTEYSNVWYLAHAIQRTEYFGTSNWHGKAGFLITYRDIN